MRLTKLPAFDPDTGHLNVVVETPKGCQNKYKYDERLKVFRLHSELPAGAVFPYDFGFIPSTRGQDGDPLDVLLLMREPAPGACVVPARLIGVIEAKQTEEGKTERNDRLIAVSAVSHAHEKTQELSDLGDATLDDIEHFFISYNQAHDKEFKPVGRHGPGRAKKLVKEGQEHFLIPRNGQASRKKKQAAGK